MLAGRLAPTPIVHCEADYSLPVRAGDKLVAQLVGVDIGRSGYTLQWAFSRGGEPAFSARVKRVAIDPRAGESIDLPGVFRQWLLETQSRAGAIA
jgi:acyl-CoA thioesterase FadM